MNVLVIPSWYPSGADKLMGVYHKEFCIALLKQKDINVNMLFIDRQMLSKPFKYLFMKKEEVILEQGYNVYVTKMLDLNKINFDLQMKSYVRKMEKAFKKYLKNNDKPDVIHAEVTIPAGYAATVIGKKYNIPVLVTEHASYFKNFFQGKMRKYGEYVLHNARFSTVSNYMAKEILKVKDICDVLPNTVEIEKFNKDKKTVKGLRLVVVSAFRKGKRIDDAIAAVKVIVEEMKFKDVKLTIVGEGLDNYYQERCLALGMDEYVQFVGRKNKEEVAEILKNNNILVITSAMETFAIPGIEALAAGIPVVATKCLGPEEYIDDKCGKLIDVGDIKGMASAIMEVYQNLDKYDLKYLRKVAQNYSDNSVAKRAIKMYKELIEGSFN